MLDSYISSKSRKMHKSIHNRCYSYFCTNQSSRSIQDDYSRFSQHWCWNGVCEQMCSQETLLHSSIICKHRGNEQIAIV